MKRRTTKYFLRAGILFLLFGIFTLLVVTFDVQPIGPERSAVGFADMNQSVWLLIGVHPVWYAITDWLGVVALLLPFGFAAAGLCQLIKRKDIRKVERSILALGGVYILTLAFYLFFEQVVVNYRPVIPGEGLEASYPSSHTLVVVCIMATATLQFRSFFPNKRKLCSGMDLTAALLIAITVIGRLLSGVHWFTDIVGGLLLAAALIALYCAIRCFIS